MDLVFTGTGPRFQTDIVTEAGEDDLAPINITFQAVVSPKSGGYQAEYSLGARIAVKSNLSRSSTGQTSTNIEYRDVNLIGTVYLKPGKAVVLSKINDKELTMTIDLAEKE
jgi:hypothetical protein